jgi:hypothetical protein
VQQQYQHQQALPHLHELNLNGLYAPIHHQTPCRGPSWLLSWASALQASSTGALQHLQPCCQHVHCQHYGNGSQGEPTAHVALLLVAS